VRLLRNVVWWQWLLAAGVVVGLVAGVYLSNKAANAVYTSTSQVLMTGQGDPANPDTAYTSNQYVNQRMTTYAQIASSAQVTGPAAQTLGTDMTTMTDQITAAVAGDTTVLNLAVTGRTPELARRNAVAVTQSFVNAITKLETNPGGTTRVAVNVITDPSTPPQKMALPAWLLVIGGAIGGAVLGGIAALVLRWLYPQRFPLKRSSVLDTSRMRPVSPPSQESQAS
jgi:capsular polysaccharide biosynthesis protein